VRSGCQSEAEKLQNEVNQMTAYGGKELANAFRTVRKNTIQVAEDIPDSQYGHVAAPECKSVGRMLAHIAIAARFWDEIHRKQRRTTMQGLDFFAMSDRAEAEESKPRSKAEIVQLLRTEGEQFAAWLETLTPEFLAEMVTEGDGKTAKSRFEWMLGAKEHEMHHRAQLILIERQLGIVPHLTRQRNERIAQMRAARAYGLGSARMVVSSDPESHQRRLTEISICSGRLSFSPSNNPFRNSGLFVFRFSFRPPGLCCFPREVLPFLRAEGGHACLHTLPFGGLAAFSSHFTHHFGNKVTSHRFIL
jgi:uncharacterized damage-inducible protein DinB